MTLTQAAEIASILGGAALIVRALWTVTQAVRRRAQLVDELLSALAEIALDHERRITDITEGKQWHSASERHSPGSRARRSGRSS